MIQRQPQVDTAAGKDNRSLGELVSELTQELLTLVRQELNLAKTEMSQKAAHIGAQAGILAAGGALAYAGVLSIVAAIVLGLIRAGLAPWLAALLVGAAVVIAGGLLIGKAVNAIKSEGIAPRQTLESLQKLKDEVQ